MLLDCLAHSTAAVLATHDLCSFQTAVQEKICLEVLEEAMQAAALEADFTFPDDSASSNGDQSLIIDDIIESLESDALEAEQEALEVRRAEEEAQVGICSCNMHVLPDSEPEFQLICVIIILTVIVLITMFAVFMFGILTFVSIIGLHRWHCRYRCHSYTSLGTLHSHSHPHFHAHPLTLAAVINLSHVTQHTSLHLAKSSSCSLANMLAACCLSLYR